jgi:hypothetical protein
MKSSIFADAKMTVVVTAGALQGIRGVTNPLAKPSLK